MNVGRGNGRQGFRDVVWLVIGVPGHWQPEFLELIVLVAIPSMFGFLKDSLVE